MNYFDDLIKKYLDMGILVSRKDEEEYCRKNMMKLVRLENGASLLSCQREVKDSNSVSINLNIRSGAQYDPPGKEGIHHFLEHLTFSEELFDLINKNLVNTNASTYAVSTKYVLAGSVNYKYPKWGLLGVLDDSIEHFLNPMRVNDSKLIDKEKNVILEELKTLKSDLGYQADTHYMNSILEEGNPFTANIIGTEDSIKNISKDDLIEVVETDYNPENFSISVFGEGDHNEANKICETFAGRIAKIGKHGVKRESHYELTSRLRSDLDKKKIIFASIPTIKNELVYVSASWIFDFADFSKEYFAFTFLLEHLNNIYFNQVRFHSGLAYDTNAFTTFLSPTKRIFQFVMVFSKEDYMSKWNQFLEIVHNVISTAKSDKSKLAEILELEAQRQRAVPINQSDRLNFSFGTLLDFGYLGNNDVNRNLFLDVKIEDIEKVLDQFQEDQCIKFVAGDIDK